MRFGSVRDTVVPDDGPRRRPRRGPRVAVDLGSGRVRVGIPAREVMVDRPSALPMASEAEIPPPAPTRGRRGADRDAWIDTRSTPAGWARPIRHGMVTDVRACARLVGRALEEASAVLPPREVLLALPSTATGLDRERAVTAVRAAAGCPVHTVDALLAAAIGAGQPLDDPGPRLVMDLGAGLTEMAVITEGRVGRARSVRYLLEQPPGSPSPRLPAPALGRLADELQQLLDDLPAGQRIRARSRGLLLTGGGALLRCLSGGLESRLAMTVRIAPDPARATIRGLSRVCLASETVRAAVASPAA